MDNARVWEHIAAERAALADALEGIAPEAWDAPSLCGGWRVCDVVAHLIVLAEATSRPGLILRHFRVDPRPNQAADKLARRLAASATPGELTQRLRAARHGRFVVPGMPPVVALGEVLVHRADIAEAAGLPRRPADDVTREVLAAELRLWFAFGVSRSIRRRRFVATDADWSVGPPDGDVVAAPGEELLLVATGRRG
jgi:uncharacterized protein (TIGR03083 family)